jgi:MerR family transcriptional regulator/heat shock protein HspR
MTEQRFIMIGKAAEIAGVHIQTLRIYERRGLLTPKRSAGGTRLYSIEDVQRLARIQQLSDEGVNLLGAIRILQLEEHINQLDEQIRQLERDKALSQHQSQKR